MSAATLKAPLEKAQVLTDQQFKQVAEALFDEAGISLPDSKKELANSRLSKRLRVLGFTTFEEYVTLIHGSGGAEERKNMISALTTTVTRFFREPHHFDDLRANVLPGLIDRAKAGGRVRLWSAGCSTGQEPYSIALTVLSMFPDAAKHNFRVLATDIDPKVTATARAGEYRDDNCSDIPKELRSRYIKPGQPGMQRMSDQVRELISIKELNLIKPWPIKGPFDVIFCRNVVIYFEEPTQRRLWAGFQSVLAPEGRLYIGHSERLSGDATANFENVGITAYRVLTRGS